MQHFADIVRDRTGGAIEIAIFPDGQIGQEANLVAQVQAGKLDFVKASASVLERSASAYRVFSLPFVFRDHAHWSARHDQFGRREHSGVDRLDRSRRI